MLATVKMKKWLKEAVETVIWAFVLAMIIRTFIVQAFWIPSGSMIPALEVGDRVLVAKFWTWLLKPSRGSVCVFRDPLDNSRDLVKRVIAIPGDTVDIRDGIIYVNNKAVDEPYVINHDKYTIRPGNIFTEIPFTVPENNYFVLGDNRPNSYDSRYWGFVPVSNIYGPVFLRYWPISRIGILY